MEKNLSRSRQEVVDDDDPVEDQAGQRSGPPRTEGWMAGAGAGMPPHGGFIF